MLNTKDEENQKITESKSYEIFLENEEYELIINLYDTSYIVFKLVQKNTILSFYYIEKYNLENINKFSYTFCKDMKEVFQFYNKILEKKKIQIKPSNDKNKICLNFKNIINFDEVVETNLELKQVKLSKDEIFEELIKEVIKLKKQGNKRETIFEEKKSDLKNEINLEEKYNNLENKIIFLENKIVGNEKKYENKINEIKNDYEKKIKEIKNINKILLDNYNKKKEKEEKEEMEEKRKLEEEEKIISLNDNVNLINNFKLDNADNLKNIYVISKGLNITYMKSVAVFSLIKNNERFYEIAYPDNKNGYNIIIYNLLLNRIDYTINKAHSNFIHKIKNYINPSNKNHILLSSSSDNSVKLWNISSNPIINILSINNCFDGHKISPFCLMFKKESYFIFGGSEMRKKNIESKWIINW